MSFLNSLIEEYYKSELELKKAKEIYEKFEESLQQNLCTHNKQSLPVSDVNSQSSRFKGSRKMLETKNIKSSPSVSSTKNGDDNSTLKLVEKKIHQFENYSNLIKQHKEPVEKNHFFQMLNSN